MVFLAAAPPPKQYNNSMLFPPATQASLSTSNMRQELYEGNVRETGNVFTRYLNSVWSKEILILIYSDKLCEIYLLMFLI